MLVDELGDRVRVSSNSCTYAIDNGSDDLEFEGFIWQNIIFNIKQSQRTYSYGNSDHANYFTNKCRPRGQHNNQPLDARQQLIDTTINRNFDRSPFDQNKNTTNSAALILFFIFVDWIWGMGRRRQPWSVVRTDSIVLAAWKTYQRLLWLSSCG